MWECGLKLSMTLLQPVTYVTPYVGVWIETVTCRTGSNITVSLLMWECGLKLVSEKVLPFVEVTPYVGVWIETRLTWKLLKRQESHSLCGSVD